MLGYEVIESPNDLNFSRSYLFAFSVPFTHVGALLSYPVAPWLTITAGTVVGWDVAKDNNSAMSYTGQFALHADQGSRGKLQLDHRPGAGAHR